MCYECRGAVLGPKTLCADRLGLERLWRKHRPHSRIHGGFCVQPRCSVSSDTHAIECTAIKIADILMEYSSIL